MAYRAQLGALTDELVAAIAADIPPTEREKLQSSRDNALRALRQHNFLRTNQFEVAERLDGLVEKFLVTGREALGNALRRRLNALEAHTTKWTPEILHMLLELSDRPAQNSRISDLELLGQEEEVDPGPRLMWNEIAIEDGWNEDRALWRNVDFADNSEDDEIYVDDSDSSDGSESTKLSSPDRQQRTAQDLVVKSTDGEQILKRVEESQAWRHAPMPRAADGRAKKIPLSGLQVLREVLFMLGGLETNLFNSAYEPVPNYQLLDVSWDTHKALVSSFAEQGRALAPLRMFATAKPQIPLLQVFHNSVQESLREFDAKLAQIQGRFVAIKDDVIVSLMNVSAELKPALVPLQALSRIVRRLREERNSHAFRYLELLFDAASNAQLEGAETAYALLGTIFYDCFRVYLRPIRTWMEEGVLVTGDRAFFVAESSTKTPLHRIWKEQFKLLKTPEGALHAPRFLQPAIQRIFATGKSIVVLKQLGHYEDTKDQWTGNEPPMDFVSICGGGLDFAPFPEVFSNAFDRWIESKHHTASATLRKLLLESYGLLSGLSALQSIYLMSDGAQADAFASTLFRHLDGLRSSWRDRFTLTEMIREAWSSLDAFRLTAKLDSQGLAHSAVASRLTVRLSLPAIKLSYRLNWPVQIIITDDAIHSYQTIFTFLLQLRRSLSILHKHHPSVTSHHTTAGDNPSQSTYLLIRTKLLWFTTNLQSYLATLVIAPALAALHEGLRAALDVDEMIAVHARFTDRVLAGACLGAKLQPIREAILDVLDLAIRLEDAHRAEAARWAEEESEITRLSVISSPMKTPARRGGAGKRDEERGTTAAKRRAQKGEDADEDEDADDEELQGILLRAGGAAGNAGKPYEVVLREIHADFERLLRFVAGGLRGVARASRDEAAGKWDLLAEMMEVGMMERR